MLVVAPALASACMTALLGGGLLVTPASPLALGRADAMLGRGMPVDAVAHYEAIAVTSPFDSFKKYALRRAARVYELELDQPADARRVLQQLLQLGVTPGEQSEVREQLAELYLAERDEQAAAHQYRLAYEANRERPALLARSAELRAARGEIVRARNLWNQLLSEHPDTWGARANLGLGELALAQGHSAQALRPFQEAAKSDEEHLAKAARLGLAACYERLGELDGAMAELDQADLPDDVRDRRKSALIERQSFKNAE
ncbi:MAG: tetratricopeptide repeat protein [Alphaproteobacteria bacterium]|nr:tetratricopeptide repeat protein [Alphaproteobacteria bacterium]